MAIYMGNLNVNINDDLDQKFREIVFRKKGMKRGNLTEAVEEALELWVNKDDEIIETINIIIEKITQIHTIRVMKWDSKISEETILEYIKTLEKLGKIAIPALNKILKQTHNSINEEKALLSIIQKIRG